MWSALVLDELQPHVVLHEVLAQVPQGPVCKPFGVFTLPAMLCQLFGREGRSQWRRLRPRSADNGETSHSSCNGVR